jgi:membrane protein
MARIKDVPHVVGRIGYVPFAKRVWNQVNEDAVFTWGAALAYSWMFAIFPFLIFLLALVPVIPERFKPDAQREVNEFIDTTMPADAGSVLKGQVDNILKKPSAGGFLSFGLLLTIWAASGGMSMTMTALDKAYDIEKGRNYFKHRAIAIGLTIAGATLVILVMILMPIGSGVIAWLSEQGSLLGWMKVLINVARYALALGLLFTMTAMIYHFGPNLKQKFHAVTPGAVFTIAVWLLLGLAFKLYLTKFGGAASYNKTYGAVAGLVILLLFFYIDALVLLIGAEINSEIDFAAAGIPSGNRPEERAVAPVPTEENKALAEEIKARSPMHAQQPPDVTPMPAPSRAGVATRGALLTVAGMWATVKIVQSIFGKRRTVVLKQRPDLSMTRAMINQRYGIESNGDPVSKRAEARASK